MFWQSLSHTIPLYLITGASAGLLAGLLGVGGGLIIVPALLWIFGHVGVDPVVVTQLAIGTSLASIIFTSLSSIRTHHQRGAVRWSTVARLGSGIVVGATSGAWAATRVDGRSLQFLLGLFALAASARMFFTREAVARQNHIARWWYPPVGFSIGAISSLFGIGGGTLTVPFLSWAGHDIRDAVGTSAACGLPIAVGGACAYIWLGQGVARLPADAWGFVHLPALCGIVCASVVFAQIGGNWAHTLHRHGLKRIFALVLAITAGKLLLDGL